MRTTEVELPSGRRVTVRELSIENIEDLLEERVNADESDDPSDTTKRIVAELLFKDEINLADLAWMVEQPQGFAFRDLSPQDVRALIPVAKELNADFFDLYQRLKGLANPAAPREPI